MNPSPAFSVQRLLRPRSVAIVGVSPNPGALGSAVLRNLERAGFDGAIHLVNPKHAQISGRACVASVDDLPQGVDCVVLAIPRAAVLEVLEACGKRGVGGVIIFSAGFAEAGEQGRADQARIRDIARAYGMVVEGPNCLGLVNYLDGAFLTFTDVPAIRLGDRKGVAIVSQSGAMAAVLSVGLLARDVGLSYYVSTGNEAASGVEDYIDYLLDDPHADTIALIVEQFRQPRRFLDLARQARAKGKRLVLLHPGRSAAARASAETHTGAMAGDYAVMCTKVAHEGVVIADRLESLLDITELLYRCPQPPAGGVMVMTESGAFKALTLDLCEAEGLALPALSEKTDSGLRQVLPDFIPPSNPLDLTAQALVDPGLYDRTLTVLLEDERYDAIVFGIILTDPGTCHLKFPPILAALERLKPSKPVIFAGLDEGADVPMEYIAALRRLGVPFFPTAERALVALARLTASVTQDRRGRVVPDKASDSFVFDTGTLPEYRSKAVLSALGVPVPDGIMATSLAEAQQAAERIGYPVVLKAQAAALSHKSDVGGVVLNLDGPQALAAGWARLTGALAQARPGLVLDGVLVEKMGPRGTELIVGAHNDPEWGPVLLVGLGGVMAEALHDVRLLPPDLSRDAIEAELLRLKGAALLRGFRGAPPVDLPAVADIVTKLGALMLAHPDVAAVDINPVVAYPQGQGALALDALIVVR
ncbi:CoA-binding protein [Niveispirillum sp. SYP-B3756]|uniref:acetate--CoA ligase family protein n=1 Tax=Niveispirillum sp. SYP-B3756 TaxID=2662178 RepID=UPI0012925E39|nr:acetate--CoA ligase family protein [Niveispirillum sp. SYP-B3756]MQP64679.1 CoA-binding protein [Niveispirillum sp. SYP-B3756]